MKEDFIELFETYYYHFFNFTCCICVLPCCILINIHFLFNFHLFICIYFYIYLPCNISQSKVIIKKLYHKIIFSVLPLFWGGGGEVFDIHSTKMMWDWKVNRQVDLPLNIYLWSQNRDHFFSFLHRWKTELQAKRSLSVVDQPFQNSQALRTFSR